MDQQTELAWNIMTELRKELLSAQQIRAQVVGFKITFVSTAIGLIVVIQNTVDPELLAIPAFAAIFFDLLINSYSIAIKRMSYYCRTYIEPKLRMHGNWPTDEPLWEEFMSRPEVKQNLSLIGNLGITILALVPAIIVLIRTFRLTYSLPVMLALIVLFIYDVLTFFKPRKIAEDRLGWGKLQQKDYLEAAESKENSAPNLLSSKK